MAKLDLENMFKNFDSIFTGGSSSSKEKNTKSSKESKKSETKTKTSYPEYKPNKSDMVYAEDANGNKIEAYWDPIAAKHFQDMKMKRIVENLHKNA